MRGLVARHADAWNAAWHSAPDAGFTASMSAMRASLDEAGRDHVSLRWTVATASDGDVRTLRTAIESFSAEGVDDLIVDVPATGLDALVRAAAEWLR